MQYLPFEELKFSWSKKHEFTLSTPWIQVTAAINPKDFVKIHRVSQYINNRITPSSPSDIALISWFLSCFKEYPFSYCLPRKKEQLPLNSQVTNKTPGLNSNSSPTDFIKVITQHTTLAETLKLPIKTWQWDAEAVLKASKLDGTGYDPLAVLSVLRRYRLREMSQDKVATNAFDLLSQLQKSDQTTFIKVMSHMIRQNHYVTEKCEESLSPALKLCQKTRDVVQDYIASEQGHDRLLAKTLEGLGIQDPKSLPVLPEIVALMAMLHYGAKNHFLAFSFFIESFEEIGHSETNPLATLLEATEEGKKAAKWLQTHQEINLKEQHDDMAKKLLSFVPAIDKDTVIAATRFAELDSLLQRQSLRRLLPEVA